LFAVEKKKKREGKRGKKKSEKRKIKGNVKGKKQPPLFFFATIRWI
jgi:hypothetical protein